MSNNLDISQVAAGQNQKEVTINDANGELDAAFTESITVDVTSANQTVSAANYRRAIRLYVTGAATAGRTVTLQAIKRELTIQSDPSNTVSFDLVLGSTTLTVSAGQYVKVYTDGTANGLEIAFASGGLRKEIIPAAAWQPTVTAGCGALTALETTAGRPDILHLPFDTTTEEGCSIMFPMPSSWAGGNIFYRVHDAIPGGQTGGLDGRTWTLDARSVADGESFDQAYGTAVDVTIDDSAAETLQRSALSAAVTPAGSPAGGEMLCLRLRRKTADAGDDLDTDALFLALELYFYETPGAET